MNKDLKDWTWDELLIRNTWEIMEAITKGEPLRTSVYSIMELTLRWNKEQKR